MFTFAVLSSSLSLEAPLLSSALLSSFSPCLLVSRLVCAVVSYPPVAVSSALSVLVVVGSLLPSEKPVCSHYDSTSKFHLCCTDY